MSLMIEGLTAGYYKGIKVIDDVSLRADEGKITVIIGPNGAGKSTLLKAVCGVLTPYSGKVIYDGKDITHLSARDIRRQGISYIAQEGLIFPRLTVEENLMFAGKIIGLHDRFLQERLEDVIERFPNLKQKLRKQAGDLSGGEQKMVAIARSLIVDAKLLLIDEPTAALSPKLTREMFEKIIDLKKDGRTVLMVEQDVRGAINSSDYTYAFVMGKVSYKGPSKQTMQELDNIVDSWLHLPR
ncbi:MAG: ATP-binding cassette domain-containing protein [Nitrososphaeria archaeon]|nr:ATP-binding cassette domain-containing protein [Nitrososphaeria archaeon]NIQ33205.1 ATP-binding cassette domain-containing protein [Nitrososphaeria archaeon]